MIPRTVQAAKAVAATFTTPQLNDYGNIILNGYASFTNNVTVAGTVGAIDTVTFTGGTGYTNGTYTGVYLGGSVGSFGYATVTVAGGIVTAVTITAGGNNFFVGQVLTLGNIPRTSAGTDATITVTAVDVKSVRPALKGWTTNYMEYYTQLPPNAYNVNPGDPTMFEYSVHSFTIPAGPIATIGGLKGGSAYTAGTYTNLPTIGGAGTGATLDITVGPGGFVSAVTLNNPGTGYNAGDTLFCPTIPSGGAGDGFQVSVFTITVVTPLGNPKWAQPPRRFNQLTVGTFTPPTRQSNAIQYSFMYPVADNLNAPPIDVL